MRVGDAVRWRVRHVSRRAVEHAAAKVGLACYEPIDRGGLLDELTDYTLDRRPIRDTRPHTLLADGRDLTLTPDGLEDILGGEEYRGLRVLEVGPKYGIHSRWLDARLEPSELVFCDFAADRHLHDEWRHEIRSPSRWVYGDLMSAGELVRLEPFDLILFLGVLYHSAHHVPLLAMLNRVARPGARMLLETTFDPRPDPCVRLRWQICTGKAKAVPTVEGLRVLLAWTGWRDVRRYTEYRPGSSEAVFLCTKTDELAEGALFADVVAPTRKPLRVADAAA